MTVSSVTAGPRPIDNRLTPQPGVAATGDDQSATVTEGGKAHPWGDNEFGFTDLLDVINPLQHIPVVNTIYRELTGDQIGYVAKLAGGALFGAGLPGLLTSFVNVAIEDNTGKDVGEHVMAFFRDESEPTDDGTQIAEGGWNDPDQPEQQTAIAGTEDGWNDPSHFQTAAGQPWVDPDAPESDPDPEPEPEPVVRIGSATFNVQNGWSDPALMQTAAAAPAVQAASAAPAVQAASAAPAVQAASAAPAVQAASAAPAVQVAAAAVDPASTRPLFGFTPRPPLVRADGTPPASPLAAPPATPAPSLASAPPIQLARAPEPMRPLPGRDTEPRFRPVPNRGAPVTPSRGDSVNQASLLQAQAIAQASDHPMTRGAASAAGTPGGSQPWFGAAMNNALDKYEQARRLRETAQPAQPAAGL
ncbi:MAG: hypothetical protein H7840_15915 [Alphaproteobacteria bacterium]